MKILWVSPLGAGIDLANRLKDTHQVVVYGEGARLPLVKQQDLYTFAKHSDLVVVDGPFPVVRTRRSWRPHQDALFFDELRRQYNVTALGPTPTVDLMVGDRRYFRKWCERLRVPYSATTDIGSKSWSSGGWFKGNEVIPPGPYLDVWKPVFKSVGFRGFFELHGYLGSDGPIVTGCSASWYAQDVPEGREAEFLQEMAK